MNIVTNQQMRAIDQMAINDYKIPGIVLMENAGMAVVEEIHKDFDSQNEAVIVCGGGNNGGDGFVIARHLINRGFKVNLFVIGDPTRIQGDARINYEIMTKLKVDLRILKTEEDVTMLESALHLSDFAVDAIFGTGLKSEVHGVGESIICLMNQLSKFIYSVDIPSGINGDDGNVMGEAVYAHKTISFDSPKCGNIMFPGADYNGELVIKPIGIPREIHEKMNLNYHLIDAELVSDGIPRRARNSHKGTYGKAKVIAGSTGMAGAAILTCKSALRSGLGLLRLYIPESLNHIVKTSVPEVVTIPLQEMRKGVIGITHIAGIIEDAAGSNVFTIGPGCGATSELSEIVKRTIQSIEIPIVLDADALNVLAKDLSVLKNKMSPIVLTPHMGEMSRLTGKTIEEIEDHPIYTAVEFAKEHGVFVVLKSARTVVATPEGHVYVNLNGNSGMATAGSGDVLTGIITGLIAQGIDPFKAAVTGVYIHGMTGDVVADEKGEHGLLAGDLIEKLPYVIKEMIG